MTRIAKMCAAPVLALGLVASVSAKQMDPTCFWQIPHLVIERAESIKKENIDSLLREAERGDQEAEMILAMVYMEGKVFPKDFDKSVYWAQRAAKTGSPGAKDLLAYISLGQESEKQRTKNADSIQDELARTRRMAETGWVFGEYAYAETLKSFGKPKEATPWYAKAAAQGCMDARTKLSHYYDSKPQLNRIEAYKWISLADYSRPPDESLRRDYDYDEKRVRTIQSRLRRDMTRVEIDEGEALAAKWANAHGETYMRRTWPDEHISYASEKTLSATIENSKGYLLVHFSSFDNNCKPCIESNARIDALSQRHHATVVFARVNREPWWEKSTILSTKYNVIGLPTTVLYREGKEQRRWIGFKTDELVRVLNTCCRVGMTK